MFQEKIKKLIEQNTGIKNPTLEIPPNNDLGDFAFPCFELSKIMKKSGSEIANELSQKLKKPNFIKNINIAGPYINFFINYEKLAKNLLQEIYIKKDSYGKQNIGKNKTIAMDISSPNIAKPLGIGHLRSTVIGASLYKIYKILGYNVVSINHLGDWGTQFGKLIYAYKNWGNTKDLKKDAIKHLLFLYIKFHQEANNNPKLDDLAREEFQKLENKDKKNLELWKEFRKLSLEEFDKIYKILKIKFDSYDGEAFYISKLEKTLETLKKKAETKISEGALIVDLDNYGMPPFFALKSNGTSSYHLRDLAAALYRIDKYRPEKLLYVVGTDQKLHFEQLFRVLDLMKMNKDRFVHVEFGMFAFKDGKMSTRDGKTIALEEVLDESIKLSKKVLEEKKSQVKNIDDTAKKIGVGAVIFNDLSTDRIKNVIFDWSKMLSFDGDSSVYLQYTYVRCHSILEKAKKEQKLSPDINTNFEYKTKEELTLIKQLSLFQGIIIKSAETYKPSYLANYLIDLARAFNEFYNNCRVLSGTECEMKNKILLVFCVSQIIKNGLALLGIETVDKM